PAIRPQPLSQWSRAVTPGGGRIAELYGFGGAGLQAAGIVRGFILALALVGNVPLAIAARLVCRKAPGLVAQSVVLLAVVALVWFVEDETIMTFAFFGYAAVVSFVTWQRHRSARPFMS
ncbi:MAG TPA: hypothetical protein VKA76_14500, partial [Gammaproteobacteria bacterium]|nr:hypothetical protein [Gammaproteobacteria bacterium]